MQRWHAVSFDDLVRNAVDELGPEAKAQDVCAWVWGRLGGYANSATYYSRGDPGFRERIYKTLGRLVDRGEMDRIRRGTYGPPSA